MHFKIIMCNDDFEDAFVCVIEMKCYAALTEFELMLILVLTLWVPVPDNRTQH